MWSPRAPLELELIQTHKARSQCCGWKWARVSCASKKHTPWQLLPRRDVDQAEREERERQEVQVAAAEEMQREHQDIVRQTVEGFTTDLIDEVRSLIVASKALPSEVIEALDDGCTVRVDNIADDISLNDLS